MKKRNLALVTVALLCMLTLFGCASSEPAVSVDVYIDDDGYNIATTVNNIIENFADYYGQTVRIEGVFYTHGTDTVYRWVMRQSFTC